MAKKNVTEDAPKSNRGRKNYDHLSPEDAILARLFGIKLDGFGAVNRYTVAAKAMQKLGKLPGSNDETRAAVRKMLDKAHRQAMKAWEGSAPKSAPGKASTAKGVTLDDLLNL